MKTEYKQYLLRMDKDLKDKAVKQAKLHKWSLQVWITDLIEKAVSKKG